MLTINLCIMKTNVEFPKKVKNSFIYFQIGLIATLLTVLIVLEFNFESQPKKVDNPKPTITINISEPSTFRIIPQSKPITATKPVQAQPKFTNQIIATTNEVPKEIVQPIETTPSEVNSDNEITNQSEHDKPNEIVTKQPENPTVLNVEELPMFPACKKLSRAEQLECFKAQMSKAVARNLIYPDDDYKNERQGRTYISFVIDESGKIIEVKAADNKNATPEMQKAAENAVRKVSKLIPAKQGGKPVRIKYTIPVTFKMH